MSIPPYISAMGEDSLSVEIGQLLLAKKYTIACAESCTGGLLSARLTAIPGSSAHIQGGVVSYANEVKENVLGVSAETLATVGAVSEETAGQMAVGVRRVLGTDIGVGITGIAGPTGDTVDKPLGLVYISVDGVNGTITTRNIFTGDRQAVRWQATDKALQMVREYLSKFNSSEI